MACRFHEADEIARVVMFMASDDASVITNQVINIGGGVSAA